MTILKKASNEGSRGSNTLNNRRIALFTHNGLVRKVVLVRKGIKTHRIRAALEDGGAGTFKVPASCIRFTREILKTEDELEALEDTSNMERVSDA